MKQYRETMDELKVPDSVRNRTLQAIRQIQAEEKKETPPQPRRIWIPLVSLAAAACLVIAIGFGFGGGGTDKTAMIYHTVPSAVIRTLPQDSHNSLTIEEYSTYLGVDILSFMGNAQLIQCEIWAEEEAGSIRQEEGTFYFNVQGSPVMLCLSKTKGVMPESLEGKPASEIGDWDVVAGVSADGTERMAAFEWGAVRCFLLARQMEQQDFENLLSGILKNFEEI